MTVEDRGAGPHTAGRADVYLHIGLPKTGTTHLQQVLWLSRQRLAATGVLVPGETRQSHMLAVWDLMGRRTRGAGQPGVPGSWQALVTAAAGWTGSHVVVSEEFLANARPHQVRRAVRAFAPARVHVVVTARYLGHVIGSAWQQQLAKGHTWSWEEFVAAVRDPEHGPATAGVGFWLHHDLVRVLDAWQAAVPPERVHLVTVPPPGSPRNLLLERFAAATRLDPGVLVSDQPEVNRSVGVAEAEVLRRLNLGLGGRLNERQYIWAVLHGVRPALQGRSSSPRIELPAEELGWVAERAGAMVAEVRSRGYEVFGDLDDLTQATAAPSSSRPDDVVESEVTAAAMAALVGMTEKYAELRWRNRRREQAVETTGLVRLTSQARAIGLRARLAALGLADRNRWVSRAVNAYLRRS